MNDGTVPAVGAVPAVSAAPAAAIPAAQPTSTPAAAAAPAAMPAAGVPAPVQADVGQMSLAALGGIDMEKVEALDRFQRFPACSALWEMVSCTLGAIGAQHQGVTMKARCLHLFGDPTGTLTAEDVVGKEYDDNHFIDKDDGTEETQENIIKQIGYIKKAWLDMGITAAGRFADVCQFVGTSGTRFTADIEHSENSKTGKKYVNMNNRAPYVDPTTAQQQQAQQQPVQQAQ